MTLGVILAVLGVPAFALRALCVGRSCDSARRVESSAPFCSLPDAIRRAISNGYYEGRSADVLAVTGSVPVHTRDRPWPSLESEPPDVPLVFWGPGIAPGVEITPGPGLEDIAPTIASVLDVERPHPGVRSGEPIASVVTGSSDVRLVLEIVWEGIGTRELSDDQSWPNLMGLFETGAGTRNAVIGTLPTDPAASLATIGTGGFPFQHGMTSSVVRNDVGDLVVPWGPGSPSSVIATLPDHLEELFSQQPVIALVATDAIANGLIGGTWGIEDRDLVSVLPRSAAVQRQTREAVRFLRTSALGRDDIPDVLGVVMTGDLEALDRSLPKLIAAARDASGDRALVVVTGTGRSAPDELRTSMSSDDLVTAIETQIGGSPGLIEAATPGGLFLDADELRRRGVYDDVVLKPLEDLRTPSGARVFADVFPAAAVTFGRFC